MSFRESLSKIPTDFTRKYDFPELVYTEQFLKEERALIQQLDDTLAALEKSYRAQATSYTSTAPQPSNIRNLAPESSLVRYFLESRNVLSANFSRFALQFGQLRASGSGPLRESFNTSYKSIGAELTRIRQSLSEIIDKLVASVKYHDRLVTQLSTIPLANLQQFQKVIAELDDKVDKAQTFYLQFRQRFLEYCQARDAIFGQIDTILRDTSDSLKSVVSEAWKIDGSLFEPGKADAFQNSSIGFNPSLWTDEAPPRVTRAFQVTVDRQIDVGDGPPLTGDHEYALVEALGDFWSIRDGAGKVWSVPAECIIPMPK
jgi:hypothetical protein